MVSSAHAANYKAVSHDTEYLREYLQKTLDHTGLIDNRLRDKQSLDGKWRFEVDPFDMCLREKWFCSQTKDGAGFFNTLNHSFEEWDHMTVPACWNTEEDRYLFYEGSAVYTREFVYRRHGEERVFLQFGAASYAAFLFLNGQYLGVHQGGSTPFCVEVTQALAEENRIIVVVNNNRRAERVPAESYEWYNYGGLFRSVEILRLPPSFIKRFQVALAPGSGFGKIQVSVEVEGGVQEGEAVVAIPELGLAQPVRIQDGKGTALVDAQPQLWEVGAPKLYEVSCAFGEDRLEDRVGFREIRTQGTDLLLNGRKLLLKGTTFHEDSVLHGRALTEAEIRENFALAQELNCNFVRLNHYPHSPLAAVVADELGILLWEEIPAFWTLAFSDERTRRDAQNQLSELILRDWNRASVIIWCVCNENEDTNERLTFASGLIDTARALDPTRLVTAACMFDSDRHQVCDRISQHVDLICVNEYYGWYQNDMDKLPVMLENLRGMMDRPAIISEFGADGGPHHRGFAEEKGTEDCQCAIYRRQVAELGKADFLSGTISWLMFDFRTPRRLHLSQRQSLTLRRYNVKGVLSADKRHRKLAFYVLQAFYAKR